METLNALQKEMIAGLTDNPAFILLLQCMEGSIQMMEDDLEGSLDEKRSLEILHKWRAMKWAHKELKTTPERFTEELAEYFEEKKAMAGGQYFPDVRIAGMHRQQQFPFAPPSE